MKAKVSIAVCILSLAVAGGCGTQRRLETIRTTERSVTIQIPERESIFSELKDDFVRQDTLVVTDLEGNEVTLMETFVDEEGNEMAHETLKAAKVTARFRNVAERDGKVSIEFDIIVPKFLVDSRWQVRFYPDMYILDDVERLEPILITGSEYREAQLRGYELYNRFINSIITDSTRFIRVDALEVFLQRNIPEVFQFKTDSSYVSHQTFYSYYGATQREAVEHYTYKMKIRSNDRKDARRERMRRKYVKSPIVYDGIRLDTVVNGADGDIIYRYVQSFKTRPKLRKVDIVLSGEIYEEDKVVYTVPETDKLTFYISSLNAFVRDIVRYRTRIIERRARANATADIAFSTGSWEIDRDLFDNRSEMGRIEDIFLSILKNEEYDLDSVTVNAYASPEGYASDNDILSGKRSESVSDYFSGRIGVIRDSLDLERGFMVDESGRIVRDRQVELRFVSHNDGENWEELDLLVAADTVMTEKDKERYAQLREEKDPDLRERRMKDEGWYRHMRAELYPKLRSVRFDFHMHRRGMIKDTVHTTVLDSTYLDGVNALRNMEYDKAVAILREYNDYNTAVAYCATGKNASALAILESLERDAQVNYMLAIVYSRQNRLQEAVQCYMHACEQEPSYVHRGNLDPEISSLIERYNLNSQDEIPTDF